MRKSMKSLALTSVVLAAIAGSSALFAADSQDHQMKGRGMIGHGDTMRQHRGMDHDGRGMMGRMSRMMDHCSAMMRRGHGHGPNDQWRKHTPENKG